MKASQNGQLEIVKLLLQNGANVKDKVMNDQESDIDDMKMRLIIFDQRNW
jgi:hypothetical protein